MICHVTLCYDIDDDCCLVILTILTIRAHIHTDRSRYMRVCMYTYAYRHTYTYIQTSPERKSFRTAVGCTDGLVRHHVLGQVLALATGRFGLLPETLHHKPELDGGCKSWSMKHWAIP